MVRLWAPYTPDEKFPWTRRRVIHLHRRASFGATWGEIERDLKDGPGPAVKRLLAGPGGAAAGEFESDSDAVAAAAVASGRLDRLRAWWFLRMLSGPDPLAERLTLLWHDHFATGYAKVHDASGASAVQDLGLMRRQNDAFRRHARGRFSDLVHASVREPALLLYLDAQLNRKEHPNENLARELLELFTLGAGNYKEADVKEAARTLTGWAVEAGRFVEVADVHDGGEKTVLGKTGRWTGSDLVSQLVKHPATAERVALKLCRLFFGERAVPPAAVAELAAGLRERELNVAWAVQTVLESRPFFEDENLSRRVQGPAEFVIGAARALELSDPVPSTLALAEWSVRMGQALFEPPNVGGWPGGRAWIDTRSLVARANYATGLVAGSPVGRALPYDPAVLPKKYGFGTAASDVLTFHHRLLFGSDPPESVRKRAGLAGIETLLASPEAQLG
jgi:uncharacterized protein (DUF1800 family)